MENRNDIVFGQRRDINESLREYYNNKPIHIMRISSLEGVDWYGIPSLNDPNTSLKKRSNELFFEGALTYKIDLHQPSSHCPHSDIETKHLFTSSYKVCKHCKQEIH